MKMAVSMLTATEANCIVLVMLCDPYCDKDRLRTYLGQCQKTANEDFSDVINGVSQENGFSPLHVSVRRCMVDATRILLQFGGDFEAKGPDGETPLMLACTTKILPLVHILVEAGADVSAVDNNGCSCTHYAAQSGSPHILHYLRITKGVDFSAKDKMCNTLLHIAVRNKHVSTVQYLLKHERSLLRMNKEDGSSPMHEACSQADAQTAIELLRAMDERLLHATNENGQTPLDLLLSSSHPKKMVIGKRLASLSSLRTVRLLAWWSWIIQLLLPGISLAFAPTSYIYLGFPLNYISPVVIVLCGFFRPLFSHRINNTVFNWPNPALFGAMLSGFTHTGICVIVYFFREWMWMHWWILTMLTVSALMFYNFIKLLKEDPGVMKVGKCRDDGVPLTIVDVATQPLEGAFCMNCEIVTPERTKHCRLCEACCKGFDHHCMWLMKCVGYGNHRRFIIFCFLFGLDNFLFVLSSCYYLVVMTEDRSIQTIWNNAVNEYPWLSFFVLCNFFTGIFAWLNFNEQMENVSSLRTKYFDSKGQIVYGKKRVFTPVSWRDRYAAIKLFFLDYDSWYKCRFGTQGGHYCNV